MNESTMQNDTEIRWIPLRNLEPSDRNARTTAAPAEAMRELEASLEAHGLLENLVVRAQGDGKTFHVVGGGRRLRKPSGRWPRSAGAGSAPRRRYRAG